MSFLARENYGAFDRGLVQPYPAIPADYVAAGKVARSQRLNLSHSSVSLRGNKSSFRTLHDSPSPRS